MSLLWFVISTFWFFFALLPSSHQRTFENPSDLSNSLKHSGNDTLIFVHTVSKPCKISLKNSTKYKIESDFHCELNLNCKFRAEKKICRHGDRNILRPYPTDPWKSETHWPGGFGELTNVNLNFNLYEQNYYFC